METKTVEQVEKMQYFQNIGGNHFKDYRLLLVRKVTKEGKQFVVRGEWGRIGQKHAMQDKYVGANGAVANEVFAEVAKTRFQHGYQLLESK